MRFGEQIYWFDLQNEHLPKEVQEEVRDLWMENDLGNDRYFYTWDHDFELEDGTYYHIAKLIESELGGDELKSTILIHWWW